MTEVHGEIGHHGRIVRTDAWPGMTIAARIRSHPRLPVLIALALLLVPLILLRAAVAGGALYQRDIHLFWHSEIEAVVRALAEGSWPVWDRTLGFGQPLLANPSAQALYPFTWLNLVMRPWRYYTLFAVAHLWLSAAGMYVLSRRLGGSRVAALTSAAAWSACGPLVSLVNLWHHFAGAAWLPWVLVAASAVGARPRLRTVLGLGAVLALQILAGSFEMCAMGGLLAAAEIGMAAAGRRTHAVRVMAMAAGGLLLALGLSSAQWMPTVEVAARSGRSGLSHGTRTYWSVHPVAAVEMVLPGLGAKLPWRPDKAAILFESREPLIASLYLGLPALGLVAAACSGPSRPRLSFLVAVWIVALAMALGRHTPFYGAAVALVPPLGMFRYPVKATVLLGFSWTLLAGMGVDACRGPSAGRALRVAAGVLIGGASTSAAVAATLLFAPGGLGGWIDVSRRVEVAAVANVLLTSAAATLVAAGIAALGARRGSAQAPLALAALSVAELVLFHRNLNPAAPAALYGHRPAVVDRIARDPASRVYAYDYTVPRQIGFARPERPHSLVRMPHGWPTDAAVALGQQMALTPITSGRWGLAGSYEIDYTGLYATDADLAAYMLRTREGTSDHRRLLEIAGVTHVVAVHEEPFRDLVPTAELPGLFERPVRVFTVPQPMPRAYLASRARTWDEAAPLLTLLSPAQLDFRREVAVAPHDRALAEAAAAGGTGEASIVAMRTDFLRVATRATGPAILVVLDGYEQGWRARVDGRDAPVIRANVLFRGIPVPAGEHVVELRYRPRGVVLGFAVSAITLVAAACAMVVAARREV